MLPNIKPQAIWLSGALFVLLQLFLQLSSGVIIDKIMSEFHLTALTAGFLSSMFYIIYTILQIPAGLLFDRSSSRTILISSISICSFGCFVFAHAPTLTGLFCGRFLMGLGAAFAFVGLAHLIRIHFPMRKFSLFMGLSETLGFATTVILFVNMGDILHHYNWRDVINTAGIAGILIAALCHCYLPREQRHIKPGSNLAGIVTNTRAWINGLIAGLAFAIVTVFASLWCVPFLQVKLGCSFANANVLTGMFFLGAGLGCPLFGRIDMYVPRRLIAICISCLLTATLMLVILYLPVKSHFIMGSLLFLTGLACGSYMLTYAIANELAPANSESAAAGFTNTLAVLTAPLLQPVVGFIMDKSAGGSYIYDISAYQHALLLLPIAVGIAGFLVFLLPEKVTASNFCQKTSGNLAVTGK